MIALKTPGKHKESTKKAAQTCLEINELFAELRNRGWGVPRQDRGVGIFGSVSTPTENVNIMFLGARGRLGRIRLSMRMDVG